MDDPKDKSFEEIDAKLDEIYGNATDWTVGIERSQRILLGIDDEPMTFDEQSIATMLKKVASNHDGLSDEFIALHSVANALLKRDDDFHLVLKQNKSGKFKSPDKHNETHNRNMSILYSLANMENKGIKTEAAVAELMDLYKLSRAAIFAAVKYAENFIQSGKDMFGDFEINASKPADNFINPRSNNKSE